MYGRLMSVPKSFMVEEGVKVANRRSKVHGDFAIERIQEM
jgi:hypothetical protein